MGGKAPAPIVIPAPAAPPTIDAVKDNAPTQATLQPGQQNPVDAADRDAQDKAIAKAKARAAAAQTIATTPLGIDNTVTASTGKAKLGS